MNNPLQIELNLLNNLFNSYKNANTVKPIIKIQKKNNIKVVSTVKTNYRDKIKLLSVLVKELRAKHK